MNELFTAGSTGNARGTRSGSIVVVVVDVDEVEVDDVDAGKVLSGTVLVDRRALDVDRRMIGQRFESLRVTTVAASDCGDGDHGAGHDHERGQQRESPAWHDGAVYERRLRG